MSICTLCTLEEGGLQPRVSITWKLLKEPLTLFFALLLLSCLFSMIHRGDRSPSPHEAIGDGPCEQIAVMLRIVLLVTVLGFCFLGRHRWDRVVLTYTLFLFLYLSYSLFISFDIRAGITAFAKVCNAIAAMLLGYHYRRKAHVLLCCVFAYIILNDAAQCVFYPLQVLGIAGAKYAGAVGSENLIQAQGLIDPAALGFANFIGMVLADRFLPPRQRSLLVPFFCIFGMLALANKSLLSIAAYFLYYCVRRRSKILFFLAPAVAIVGGATFLFFQEQVADRLRVYVYQEEISARTESYRVMMESLEAGNVFGEGLGSFGGPASIQYESPIYEKYGFDWAGLVCSTTDTYYPHLFVELGLMGGMLFLAMFLLPLLSPGVPRVNRFVFFAILMELFWESVTEFHMEDVKMLFVSVLVLFPLCHGDFQYLSSSLFNGSSGDKIKPSLAAIIGIH